MKKLSKENFKRLREAIGVAYPRRGALLIFVREELGENLDAIVPQWGGLRDAIAELLIWVESKGRLAELIACLRQEAGHPDVVELCDQLFVPQLSNSVPSQPKDAFATLPLQVFSDETVTVDASGRIVKREVIRVPYFTEMAGNVGLDMVAISGGRYLRGSPNSEAGRYDEESPQFEVSVPDFFMGRYAVTQAQWKAVAQLPKVDRDLEADPSRFKGDRRPVEQVSWDDAQEFCARLSQASGKLYRLPSEAEWEYACRAGTTTPFAFGETTTTEIVNYNGNSTYANAPKGEYREQTVDVGSFLPNAWGLYDMHGNVWEWCEDAWHGSYRGAPVDGSVRIDNSTGNRVQRGGSWSLNPGICRSTSRADDSRDGRYDDLGFRVLCVSPRTL